MRRSAIRDWLCLGSAVLLLGACGGAPEDLRESSEPVADSAAAQADGEVASLSAPTVSISCARPAASNVTCTASASGGVPPYRYFWSQTTYRYDTNRNYHGVAQEGGASRTYFICTEPNDIWPAEFNIKPWVYVLDATGVQSMLAYNAQWFTCM
ncbi:SprB repeat-containing protein [Pyxidicoccus xibeiensis]|uniref:SprB repeat-containing protein n=1 Tax=Pyxidicoccus xibeiensis TaxID=2906759 RepID=UPI0020A7B56C|nr:SprB repeat-containing protein [Pyxidicoccus xibeiensis]MCP3139119.1 SprB repeat-containing protein [Pyxidicoccus xibeiensis]